MILDETRWLRWLSALTHEKTGRGIARVVGVSHTQVQRWVSRGVPAQTAWELTVRFKGDPVATMVVLGRVAPDDVLALNYEALVRYAPSEVLTAELHARAMVVKRTHPEIETRRKAVSM